MHSNKPSFFDRRDVEVPSYHRAPPPSVRDPIFEEDFEDFRQRKRPVYSRLIALMLALVSLGAAGAGAYFFLAKDEIDLQKGKSQHDNFQGIVDMVTIASHAEPQDCWMVIHGNVFDMTEYAPIHPGPPSLITRHCGNDATKPYDFEHSIALLPIVNEYLLGTLEEVEASESPSVAPAVATLAPTTKFPSSSPSMAPTTSAPTTMAPSSNPSVSPTTSSPTMAPTPRPTEPEDTARPTTRPTTAPPTTLSPTPFPTMSPTTSPPTRRPTNRPTTAPPTRNPTAAPKGCSMEFYTLADVAQHPNANSCWYILYGVVYDFTTYIDRHDGGRGTVLGECGTEATAAYQSESGHNINLLRSGGFSSFIIGRYGTRRETGTVPCDEVDLVAVSN